MLRHSQFKLPALFAAAVSLLAGFAAPAKAAGGYPDPNEKKCLLKISVQVGRCATSENTSRQYRDFIIQLRQSNPAAFLPQNGAMLARLKQSFWNKTFTSCGSENADRICSQYTRDDGGKNLLKEVAQTAARIIEFRESGRPEALENMPEEILAPENDKWQANWLTIEKIINANIEDNHITLSVPRLCRKAGIASNECWEYLPALNRKLTQENREMDSARGKHGHHGGPGGPGNADSGSDSSGNTGGGYSGNTGGTQNAAGNDAEEAVSGHDIAAGIALAGSAAAPTRTASAKQANLASGAAGRALLAGGSFGPTRDPNAPLMVEGAYSKRKNRQITRPASSEAAVPASAAFQPAVRETGGITATPQAQLAEQYLRNAKEKENFDPARAAYEAGRAVAANPNDPAGYAARAVYLYKADSEANADSIMLDSEKALGLAGTAAEQAPLRFQMHNIRRLLYKNSGEAAGELSEARQMLDELQTAALNAQTPEEKAKYRELLVRGYQEYRDRITDYSLLPELGIAPAELTAGLAPATEKPAAPPPPAPKAQLPFALRILAIVIGIITIGVFILAVRWVLKRAAAPTVRLPPSGSLQHYDIIRKLGEGGMGEVYLAEDRALGRKVAIKRLHTAHGISDAAREQLLNEARTVASLHHPNIVDIYTLFREGEDLFLVFEYIDGETLDCKLDRDGRMPLSEVKPVFEAICKALDYAHRNGVIHRDLKLSNIMMASSGVVKVMDFGVARKMDAEPAKTVSGTPAYMAPEQKKGLVRPESDIYSLGICLYEVVTGHIPWELDGVQPDSEYIVAPTQIDSSLPKELDSLLEMALCEDYHERISTAAEFWELLKNL